MGYGLIGYGLRFARFFMDFDRIIFMEFDQFDRILYHKSLSNKQENEEIVSEPFFILVWSMSLKKMTTLPLGVGRLLSQLQPIRKGCEIGGKLSKCSTLLLGS